MLLMAKRKQALPRAVVQPKGDALADKLREYYDRGMAIQELGSGHTEKELRELFNVYQDQLYKTLAFARYYDPQELGELCAARNADGDPLRWTHVRELLAYRDNKKPRLKMQKWAVREGWTVDELHEHIQFDSKVKSRSSATSPGRPFKFKSVTDLVRKSAEMDRQLASLLASSGDAEESSRRIDRLLAVRDMNDLEPLQEVLRSLTAIERQARRLKRAVRMHCPQSQASRQSGQTKMPLAEPVSARGRVAAADRESIVRFRHSSIDSTSATKRVASSLRNAETTLNTASLKPPMFRMSSRSGA